MDAGLNRKSLMFGIPGIILQIVGNIAMPTVDPNNPNAADVPMVLGCIGIMLLGTVLLIIGLSLYARAKGHSGWWGLMGLLSIIGLIVLACLPDRLKAR
jgi:amino acid transporter